MLNPKLARSQLIGGMLWGLSQALLEGNPMDTRYGRWGAISLGEYLVPVNADAPEITIEFVEVEDTGINPLGVKGVGEIGQVGSAAAIANAVFNATGRRIRELPIAAELVMDPAPVSLMTAGTTPLHAPERAAAVLPVPTLSLIVHQSLPRRALQPRGVRDAEQGAAARQPALGPRRSAARRASRGPARRRCREPSRPHCACSDRSLLSRCPSSQ